LAAGVVVAVELDGLAALVGRAIATFVTAELAARGEVVTAEARTAVAVERVGAGAVFEPCEDVSGAAADGVVDESNSGVADSMSGCSFEAPDGLLEALGDAGKPRDADPAVTCEAVEALEANAGEASDAVELTDADAATAGDAVERPDADPAAAGDAVEKPDADFAADAGAAERPDGDPADAAGAVGALDTEAAAAGDADEALDPGAVTDDADVVPDAGGKVADSADEELKADVGAAGDAPEAGVPEREEAEETDRAWTRVVEVAADPVDRDLADDADDAVAFSRVSPRVVDDDGDAEVARRSSRDVGANAGDPGDAPDADADADAGALLEEPDDVRTEDVCSDASVETSDLPEDVDSAGAVDSAGFWLSKSSSKPSNSSPSSAPGELEGLVEGWPPAGADAPAASFKAANNRSGSLLPSKLSGSTNSSVASAGSVLRDPALAVAPEDADVAPTGTLPSMGASTGRSVSGSKTGRDAASIVSGLVNASSNANGIHGLSASDADGSRRACAGPYPLDAPDRTSRAEPEPTGTAAAPWPGTKSVCD
jgi:hypothetical protein